MQKLFFIGFLFIYVFAPAQTKTIDSLRQQVMQLNDTARVNALLKLAERFSWGYIHSDSALKYADSALGLASALH